MLPKNKLRKEIVEKNLIMYRGAYHTMQDVGLPQFTDAKPRDINLDTGLDLNPEDNIIKFVSARDGSIPEEYQHFKKDIDPSIGEPLLFQ